MNKIGFGGGCHWCTEGVFLSLQGVEMVEQGFIASIGEETGFSEAVIVHYNPKTIPLSVLTEIHLLTHKSTSNHSMRSKYRSAVYVYSESQYEEVKFILKDLQRQFTEPLITKRLFFNALKDSEDQYKNYYYSNPNKPFCKTFIAPKLKLLLNRLSEYVKPIDQTF